MRILYTFLVVTILLSGCGNNRKKDDVEKSCSELKVMTWNIWGKLNLAPKYTINGKTARKRVIEIIKESEADIVTMTETYGSAKEIAEALNFHYYTPAPDANLTIFSRYPLASAGNLEKLSSFSFIQALVNLPNNKQVKVFNIWLTSGGRHIVEIKNKELSDDAFNKGDENRYKHIQELLTHKDFKSSMLVKDEIPVVVAGDFNCVSHLDYTKDTKEKALNYSRVLDCQTSKAMAESGFIDSYRFVHPKVTTETLGYTWTTVGQGYTYKSGEGFVPVDENPRPQYQDPYARIDYIYCTGKSIKPVESKTILYHSSNLQRSFPEFPSDHGAVLTTFELR
jgi:exonuclease III